MKETHHGSCHCGAVKFAADFDLAQGTFRCNCSICFKSRAWLAGVPASGFRLVEGESSLQDYQFGKKRLHHYFCKQCGVRPFSRGADPKGEPMFAIRVNCLDGVDPRAFVEAPVKYFDMLHDDMHAPAETRYL
ncbi:MAG TPA: GFA family protein [Burkholderiales bacterium]|nr:GFA family protein [Burkholderiales bacterium]